MVSMAIVVPLHWNLTHGNLAGCETAGSRDGRRVASWLLCGCNHRQTNIHIITHIIIVTHHVIKEIVMQMFSKMLRDSPDCIAAAKVVVVVLVSSAVPAAAVLAIVNYGSTVAV